MLLDSNTKKVIDLVNSFDNLKNVDKVRLAINILENLYFKPEYDTKSFITLLKEILGKLDPNYLKVIVNFSKYQTLTFLSAKYMELSLEEKQKFSVEMLFNIYETDFEDEKINTKINNELTVYDYCYSLNL